MTVSVTMLLSVVLPILATTILFALLLSLVLLFGSRPRGDRAGRKLPSGKVEQFRL